MAICCRCASAAGTAALRIKHIGVAALAPHGLAGSHGSVLHVLRLGQELGAWCLRQRRACMHSCSVYSSLPSGVACSLTINMPFSLHCAHRRAIQRRGPNAPPSIKACCLLHSSHRGEIIASIVSSPGRTPFAFSYLRSILSATGGLRKTAPHFSAPCLLRCATLFPLLSFTTPLSTPACSSFLFPHLFLASFRLSLSSKRLSTCWVVVYFLFSCGHAGSLRHSRLLPAAPSACHSHACRISLLDIFCALI